MFAPEFSYHRASSIAEAGRLLAEHPGAKVLAGGHSLIPILKLRLAAPSVVIDIGRIPEMKGIAASNGAVTIGALTTHAELASSEVLRQRARALAEAAAQIGDPAVRNRGTIGGNVAHADPASDLPQALVALGATFHLTSPGGSRSVAAEDFFEGLMTTSLREDELLASIELPAAGPGQGSAYAKLAHPASRYAVIGAAASVTLSAGKCTAASVVLGGLTDKPTRAASVEAGLVGQAPSADVIAAASKNAAADLDGGLIGDIYASEEYRRAVAHVWVRRALTAAAERCAG